MLSSIAVNTRLVLSEVKNLLHLIPKAPVSLQRKELDHEGNHLSYLYSSQPGPALIFLPGWGQTKESWAEVLAKLACDFTVLALDLPGFGKSSLSDRLTNPNNYAAVIKALLVKEGIHSCILVGHSFGGKIAVLFTCLYPKRVEKLVLSGVNLNLARRGPAWLARLYAQLTLPLFNPPQRRLLKRLYQETHFELDFIDKSLQIQKQALLIYGQHDPITPPSCGKALSQLLPRADLKVLPQASHLAHLDQEDKFTQAIRDFVGFAPHAHPDHAGTFTPF